MVDIINNMNEVVNNKVELLFGVVSVVTGVEDYSITGKGREREKVLSRSIMGYMLHIELGLTVVQTGSIINRDHSTIVYYCKTHSDNFKWCEEYRIVYTKISETFWGHYDTADKNDIGIQIASLERLINRLEEKKTSLMMIN
tara:strand:+ start:997 stop:1422 length:426 start_codon:yes stop_codon:yes gene_type:complete